MAEKRIPTDAEIMKFRNVPVEVAAAYIGWTPQAIRWSLCEGRASFGTAVQGKSSWTFHISPGALMKYQHGDLPAVPSIKELQTIMADGVTDLVNARLGNLNKVLQQVMGA